MFRAFKYLLIISVLLFTAYSGFWFYKAKRIENFFRANLEAITLRVRSYSPGANLSYKDVKVYGYPLNIYVDIFEPEYSVTSPNGVMRIKSNGKIKAGMEIFNNSFNMGIDGEVLSEIKDKEKDETYKKEMTISYEKYPELRINLGSLTNMNKLFWTVKAPGEALKKLGNLEFESIAYSDKGMKAVDNKTSEILSSSDEVSIYINKEFFDDKQKVTLKTDFRNLNNEKEYIDIAMPAENSDEQADKEMLNDLYKKVGKTNLITDISIIGPAASEIGGYADSSSEVEFKTLKFDSDYFGLEVKGNIKYGANNSYDGKLELLLKNYNNLIDFIAIIYNFNMRKAAKARMPKDYKGPPVQTVSEKNIKRLKEVFNELANETSDNGQTLLITITKQYGVPYIGKKPYMEAVMLLQQSLFNLPAPVNNQIPASPPKPPGN